ncbi:MAG: dihydroorotase [Betaproteobacteria bacterium]|nr:dihydroorotase [Betaproteobacteria bacterium]
MNLEIRNGRVVDPAHGVDAPLSLYIAQGRVAAVGDAPAGFVAERVIDAAGCVVCPGLIDVATRLREPGFEYKATLASELRAAVAGGVTGVACLPDTDPPLDEPGLVEMLRHRARLLDRAHVYPIGALTVGLAGAEITEMGELAEAGCVAFSQAEAPIGDTQVLLRAMQYAATFGHRVWLRPQDPHLGRAGVVHDGEVATRLGLPGIPASAEAIALATIFALMRETGATVHLCRLSSAQGVAMVRAARKDGLAVTCDVAVHHLHLCDVDIGWFDTQCHLVPPLRGTRDRAALRAGVADGTIDLVCSDHTPVDDDGKQLPFAESEPGATGLELLLPLTLKWAREDGVSLLRALERITSAAAAVLGCPGGSFSPGAPADVCVFDPEAHWTVGAATLSSQGRNTPFLGLEVSGQVRQTLVGGRVVFER